MIMVIPKTLTAEEFKSAPPEDQALYSKGEDESYTFVGENAGELRRGKSRVSAALEKVQRERDEALSKLNDYEESKAQAELAKEEQAKEAADAKQIDEYWKGKHQKEIKAKDEIINKLNQSIINQYRDSVITTQASKLAMPEHDYVIKLALRQRINATIDSEGRPQTVVYDQDGRPGHDTLDDLAKEFKKDPRFKSLLKGAEVGSGTAKPQEASAPPASVKEPAVQSSEQLAADFRRYSQANPDRLAQFLKTTSGQ